MFNLEPIGPNSFEPVTVSDLKTHARIYTSADDSYIGTLLIGARQQVEQDLEIAIVDQEYHLHLQHWLDLHFLTNLYLYGNQFPYPDPYVYHYPRIVIPIQPVRSVASITYTDLNGDTQTLDSSQWTLKTFKDPVHIMLKGQLPGIQPYSDIIVDFAAGSADADSVSQLVKQAIMFLASHWYEVREAVGPSMQPVPDGYERIINRLRVKRFR